MRMMHLLTSFFLAATLAAAVATISLTGSVMDEMMRDPFIPVYSF